MTSEHDATVLACLLDLLAADREFDAAAAELAEAKRAKDSWRVNPLQPTHPAVLRMRAAKARRTHILAKFKR